MIYSIGDVVDLQNLVWSSDWNAYEILGEDYPFEFVIGLYIDKDHDEVSYYLDMRDGKVIAVFIDEDDDNVISTWNEEYLEW